MLDAAATAAMTATADQAPVERRRDLTPAAIASATRKVRPRYSPIVIAGVVRVIDFVMLRRNRHRALFRICRPSQGLFLGISRSDLRRGCDGRDLASRPPISTRCSYSAATSAR
jgi:hypothetical protein